MSDAIRDSISPTFFCILFFRLFALLIHFLRQSSSNDRFAMLSLRFLIILDLRRLLSRTDMLWKFKSLNPYVHSNNLSLLNSISLEIWSNSSLKLLTLLVACANFFFSLNFFCCFRAISCFKSAATWFSSKDGTVLLIAPPRLVLFPFACSLLDACWLGNVEFLLDLLLFFCLVSYGRD